MIGQSLSAQFGSFRTLETGDGLDIIANLAKIADLNGDGINDVMFRPSQPENNLYVRWGIPDYPYFDPKIEFVIDDYGNFILADFDQDSDVDIVVFKMRQSQSEPGYLNLYLNDGNGNFTYGSTLETPDEVGAQQAIANDIDQDGDQDILLTVYNSGSMEFPEGMMLLENDGSGNFEIQASSTDFDAYAIAAGDIDGDNDKDIWVTHIQEDKISVYENLSNEGFSLLFTRPAIYNPTEIHLEDMNGDGMLDAVMASNSDNHLIGYFENQGAPDYAFEFSPINTASESPSSTISLADYDNNGTTDVIYTGNNWGTGRCYSNDGSGEFTNRLIISGEGTFRLVPVFLNDDEYIDFINISTTSFKSGIAINRGEGFSSELSRTHFDDMFRANDPISLSAFQADGDAKEELLVVNSSAPTALTFDNFNIPVNAEATQFSIEAYTNPKQGSGLDADDDGDADFMVLFDEGLVLYSNEGNTQTSSLIALSEDVTSFQLHDINADGTPDILARDDENNSLYVWYSSPDGYDTRTLIADDVFAETGYTYTTLSGGTIVAGVVYQELDKEIVNLPYTGFEQFGAPIILKRPMIIFRSMHIADTDGDELPDLVGHGTTALFQFPNVDGETLGNVVGIDFEEGIEQVYVEDFSKDGFPDILVHSKGESCFAKFYLNNGAGEIILSQGTIVPNVISSTLIDFDGDGDNDIVLGKFVSRNLVLITNKFEAPASEIVGSGSSQGGLGMYIYPNPTANSFRLSNPDMLEGENVSIHIHDAQGKLVYQKSNDSKYDEINISDLPSGTYVVNVTDPETDVRHFVMLVKDS
jgi:hypothetical protein